MPVGIITLNSGVGYALGALCLAMLSVGVLRYTRDRRAGARDLTREQRARLRDQQRVREGMEELLQQLEEVTRRIDADVGTRFAKLEGLLRAADKRIDCMQKLTGAPAVLAPDPPKTDAGSSQPEGPVEQPETRRQHVYELANTGATSITIADRLHMPVGEVELLLNLRRYR